MASSICMDLNLVNAVNALQNLTLDQTKDLALRLGVKLNVLIDIESEQRGETRKAHYIQAWLDIDTEANWEKIIAALKQIGMEVVAAHVIQYLSNDQSPDPTPLPGFPHDDASQPITPEVDPKKVDKAKATIQHLENSFSDVMSDTCEKLCEKESKDPKFLNIFRNKLLLLPVAKKRIHVKFFRDSEDEIIDAKNIRKLFAILSRYCDYRNYEVLFHLVNKFCEATKSSMMKYCSEIKSFELTTTVDVYLVATSASAELSLVFTKMVVKMNKKTSSCSLHDIRNFNEALSEKASLAPHSVYIQAIGPGSVVVELRFPSSAVGWVLAAMTPDFLHTHNLIEVTVDGQPLTTIQKHQHGLDEELWIAARSSDVVRVASLLNSGADIEIIIDSTNPLMVASSVGHITTLWLLLDRGAIVDGKNEGGGSALMRGARYGKTDIVVELVKEGADIDMQNDYGESALMVAARHGETDIVLELMKGADIHMKNINGDSALMIAARYGKTDIVVELMKGGADIHMQNKIGNTALIIASICGSKETIVVLLKAGADVNLQNNNGDSAVMIAATYDNTDAVVELVKEGADIHIQNKYGNAALIRASGQCGTEAVVELVKAGADVNLRNNYGQSALMRAAGRGMTKVVIEVAKAGANLNLQDSKDSSEPAAIELIKDGANLDIQNEDGDTAVILATVHSKPAALQELVRAGADLNVQNNEGLTALMISVRTWGWSWSGHKLTDILLSGKNIDMDFQENSTGWSALFFATENGNVNTLQSLLKAGANAYLKDKSGLTVLEFATAFCEETKDPDHRQHSKHKDLLSVCKVLRSYIQKSTDVHGHHDMPSDQHTSTQDIASVNQDPSTGVQDTADQGTSRKDQDIPRDQHTSPTDSKTPPAIQVTTPPTTTVTQAIKNTWNSMMERANNLLHRIDGRLRSAKKKAEREEKLMIMDDNQLREEQAELRELEEAAAIEWKKRGRARDNRSSTI